jgi:hypothetical protein
MFLKRGIYGRAFSHQFQIPGKKRDTPALNKNPTTVMTNGKKGFQYARASASKEHKFTKVYIGPLSS